MRALKNDVSRYMEIDNDEILEESGWKLIHGDVFRFPSHINLLAALIGSGVQVSLVLGYNFVARTQIACCLHELDVHMASSFSSRLSLSSVLPRPFS